MSLFMPKLVLQLHPQLALWAEKSWDFVPKLVQKIQFPSLQSGGSKPGHPWINMGKKAKHQSFTDMKQTQAMQGYKYLPRRCQSKARAGCSMQDGELGGNRAGRAGASSAPTPQYLREADSESVVRVSPESRSSDKSLLVKQVWGHTTKLAFRSGAGLKLGEPDPAMLETSSLPAGTAGPEPSLNRAPAPWAGCVWKPQMRLGKAIKVF